MKKEKKSKIILLLTSVLVSIAVIYYFGSLISTLFKQSRSTPVINFEKYNIVLSKITDISTWRSYSNKYISFKYPETWEVVDCGMSDWLMIGPKIEADQKIDCKSEFPHPNPAIFIFKAKNVDTPDVYQGGNILLTETYIDNKYGQVISHLKPNGDLGQQEVYLKYPDYFYLIHLWDKDSKKTFDQILSTFKFTK